MKKGQQKLQDEKMVHYQTRGRENDECRGEKVRTLPGGSGNV